MREGHWEVSPQSSFLKWTAEQRESDAQRLGLSTSTFL
jgi:hypothetical protein